MNDYRTRAGAEAEILAEVEISPLGIPRAWFTASRLRPAALRRLLDAGTLEMLPCKHPEAVRLQKPKAQSKRLRERLFS